MEFLFLPPIYLVTLLVAGVTSGLLAGKLPDQVILGSGILFSILTVSQLIFRIVDNSMPERLVGQLIYFLGFLLVVWITKTVKNKLIG